MKEKRFYRAGRTKAEAKAERKALEAMLMHNESDHWYYKRKKRKK